MSALQLKGGTDDGKGAPEMDEIQRARYDRVFDAYAYDEYITWEGFDRHTRILAEIQGRSPDAPAIVALREELRSIWDSLATMADSDHDGRINRDEWRVSAEGLTASLREAQEQGVPWPFDHWVEVLYRAIDSNGDGRITRKSTRNGWRRCDLLTTLTSTPPLPGSMPITMERSPWTSSPTSTTNTGRSLIHPFPDIAGSAPDKPARSLA